MRMEGRLNHRKYVANHRLHLLFSLETRLGGAHYFIVQEDNCDPHRAINVGKYLALHGVKRLQRVLYSQDIPRIEHAWCDLEDRLRARRRPSTLDELLRALS